MLGSRYAGDLEARLLEAEHLARIGSWSWIVGEDVVAWSPELYRIYGVEPEDGPASFDAYLSFIHPDDRQRVETEVGNTLQNSAPYEHEYRVIRPDGAVRWMHARGEVVEAEDGRPLRLGGYCQDVTERKVAEDEAARARADLAHHEAILEGIARGDSVGETLTVICEDVEREFPGTHCSVLIADSEGMALHHAAAPSLPESFTSAIDGLPIEVGQGACGTAAARREVVIVKDVFQDPLTADWHDLARRHNLASVWSQPLVSSTGQLLGTFAVYRAEPYDPDPVELEHVRAARHLAALAVERDLTQRVLFTAARFDSLTGLPNRAHFLAQLTERLGQANGPVVAMFLDIDRFKWINDSLGHPAGDRLLIDIARRLDATLGGRHLGARFGGDEFTVLVDGTLETAEQVALEIDAAFKEPFSLDGGEFFLSVSIGLATGEVGTSADEVVRDADIAMYAAKDAGRGRRIWFDAVLRSRATERVTMEADLRRALGRDEFVIEYQPIIRVPGREWIGVEALLRWNHPERGRLSPDIFVPLAEECGLIGAVGSWILDRVIADAAAWSAGGLNTNMAVNVSVTQLTDPGFAGDLAQKLAVHHLPPERLIIEITESEVMDRLEVARSVLQALADAGTPLLIDDFGTGHSSIARLRDLTVTGLKIDRSFTARAGLDASAERMIAAMTDLAHALGLIVVAEGVESEAAYEVICNLGCDQAQGYIIGRPAPPDEVVKTMTLAL